MKKIYTSPDVQEDRLGLDRTVLCFIANLFINLDLLEGIQREISWIAPVGIRPPGVLAAWLVAGIKWFRPLLGECVDSTPQPHRPLDETPRGQSNHLYHGHK